MEGVQPQAQSAAETQPSPPVTRIGRTRRVIYASLGLLFVGLAIVGVFLPGLPTTINVIVAGFFFSRSSPRFDAWLVNHRVFGPIITDYRSGAGFTKRAKTIAISAMLAMMTLSVWLMLRAGLPWYFVLTGMTAVAFYAVWFILNQPTKPQTA